MTQFHRNVRGKSYNSKYRKKENRTNTGQNKQEYAGLQFHYTKMSSLICISNIIVLASIVVEKSSTKNQRGRT